MILNQRIYFTILFYIALILLTAGSGLWMILSHTGIIIGSVFIFCSLFQIKLLTQKLNTFNRKIQFFLDSVQDKENMLYFPEKHVDKDQEMLHRSLNRINDLLAKAKSDIQKQEYFYRSLLEEVPNGILAWDSSGKILVANSTALSLLECDQLTYYYQLERLLQKNENRQKLTISKSSMIMKGEKITLLSIKDISDELSDKENESWNKLTHVLTHEIMNTITPIVSLSQTLLNYQNIGEKTTRGLRIIQSQSERLMEFTESFRHLSYLPHPNRKTFSLSTLLCNLKELMQTDFKANSINFSLSCTPASINIEGDENQLSQVILNLLKNAMQALDGMQNGAIHIRVQQTNRITINVIDNGPGILPELQEKVFIPFFSTKAEGMGIGLSLCRQIIRLHKGHLLIEESHSGKTVFTIDLPTTLTQ